MRFPVKRSFGKVKIWQMFPLAVNAEVFLTVKAPYRPLDTGAISQIVRRNLTKTGIKAPGHGSRSFRHSWKRDRDILTWLSKL